MPLLDHQALDRAITDEPELMLVFLRHRGCLFTRQLIESVREASAAQDGRVILLHQATPEEFEGVLGSLWPEAEHVSDPGGTLYRRFEIERGGMKEMFGARSWLAGIPAFLRGYRIGWKGKADGWTLPTVLWFEHGAIVREHRGTHAGDNPDFALITS